MDIFILYSLFCYPFIIPILARMNEVFGRQVLLTIIWFLLAPIAAPFIIGLIASDKIK